MNKKIISSVLGIIALVCIIMFMLNLTEKESVNSNKFSDDAIEEVDMNELIVEEETDLISLNKVEKDTNLTLDKESNQVVDSDTVSDLIDDLNEVISNDVSEKNIEVEDLETPVYKIETNFNKKETAKTNVETKGYQPLTIYGLDQNTRDLSHEMNGL